MGKGLWGREAACANAYFHRVPLHTLSKTGQWWKRGEQGCESIIQVRGRVAWAQMNTRMLGRSVDPQDTFKADLMDLLMLGVKLTFLVECARD